MNSTFHFAMEGIEILVDVYVNVNHTAKPRPMSSLMDFNAGLGVDG
jgi:hypothetical protein